jgi:RNA polymerase sigma-70 factor (ECF subfamily)
MNRGRGDLAGETGLLAAHLFRHQAGQITASLTRILGWGALETAEDVVQEALVAALETWPYRGLPDQPAAWLWRVARNRAMDHLRRNRLAGKKLEEFARELEARDHPPVEPFHGLEDDLLAALFACAHPSIPEESQVALMLRVLCGFTTQEIAQAYLESESAVSQRIVRAKKKLRESGADLEGPSERDLSSRTEVVLLALYLMFNEGYSAHSGPTLLRDEFCAEAIRLNAILCAQDATDSPTARALLALMYFQSSRLVTRTDAGGDLLLLSEQDRAKWDQDQIALGFAELERASCGTRVSTYHLEAGIAACHVAALRYEDTDWMGILALYDQLVEMSPSPVFALNRAVAVGMVQGNRAALRELAKWSDDERFVHYHPYFATLAEFCLRAGRPQEARLNYRRAIDLAGSEPERRFLKRRLSEA